MDAFVLDEIEDPKPTERKCRPCDQKGSYMGRMDCGWRLNDDRKKSHTCELLDYKLCNREYEHSSSVGVLNHLKRNPEAKFQGCKNLDQTLFEEKELSLEPSTFEVISDDPFVMTRSRDDGFDSLEIPDIEKLIITASSALKTIDDFDKKQGERENLIHETRSASPDTPLAAFLSPAPESLEHLHFRNLVSKNYFKKVKSASEAEQDLIVLVASLLVRGYWDIEVINEAFPGIEIQNFEELKRKVCLHVRMTLPKKALSFEKFWEELTHKQREALWLYYMKNPYKRSREFVASKIGISVDALKDRITSAITKLKSAFPELQDLKAARLSTPEPEVAAAKIYSKDEIAAFESSRKSNPQMVNRNVKRFNSIEEFKAWDVKTRFYPNTSGVW